MSFHKRESGPPLGCPAPCDWAWLLLRSSHSPFIGALGKRCALGPEKKAGHVCLKVFVKRILYARISLCISTLTSLQVHLQRVSSFHSCTGIGCALGLCRPWCFWKGHQAQWLLSASLRVGRTWLFQVLNPVNSQLQ